MVTATLFTITPNQKKKKKERNTGYTYTMEYCVTVQNNENVSYGK